MTRASGDRARVRRWAVGVIMIAAAYATTKWLMPEPEPERVEVVPATPPDPLDRVPQARDRAKIVRWPPVAPGQ